MTDANGILRQTIYYPYSWALQFARGAVLDLLVQSSTYEVAGLDQVAHVDVAGAFDPSDGKLCLFILNRDLSQSHHLEVVWEDAAPSRLISASVLTGEDLKAANSFAAPRRVVPQSLAAPESGGARTKFEVPAHSYTAIQWSL
jgi:alpha-N-arabinofuranosidase